MDPSVRTRRGLSPSGPVLRPSPDDTMSDTAAKMEEVSRLDPRFQAGFDLMRRTGARDIRIGFSPEEDGDPTVWYVVATWDHPKVGTGAETASALDPVTAVLRLCEKAVENGRCAHCDKLTIFVADTAVNDGRTRLDRCAYVWDETRAIYRRGCEGHTP